jgi:hypothetical protein
MSATSSRSGLVSFEDLRLVYEHVSIAAPSENRGYICTKTGRTYVVSDFFDGDEVAPEDVETSKQYISVPHRYDLDLGRNLVFTFVDEHLPGEWEAVRDIFRRKGAYSRFKHLLQSRGMLDKWYAFEESAVEKALREWAQESGIEFSES